MDRRAFMAASTIAILTAPLAAEAEESRAGKVSRLGHLSSLDTLTVNHAAFREKLRELGWVEGTNIFFEDRFAGRDGKRLATLAAELAHLPVDLIFTTGGVESALAAKSATKTIPILLQRLAIRS